MFRFVRPLLAAFALLLSIQPLFALQNGTVTITSPQPVTELTGTVNIIGTADVSDMRLFFVEASLYGTDSPLWIPVSLPNRSPVDNGLLGSWDTTLLADGVYSLRLEALLYSGQTLDYTVEPLRLTNGQEAVVPQQPSLRGTLTYGDSIANSLSSTAGDVWRFDGTEGDRVTIAMSSTSFDAYLELYAADQAIASDDDSGGNHDALIANFTLPATGGYAINARSYGSDSMGPYTLSLTRSTPAPILVEEFDSAANFTQTSSRVYVSDGKAHWNISRSGGDQFIYRSIPPFSGNVRLSVTGEVDNWTNNCQVRAGIGDGVGSGISINYGFTGGGCSTSGPLITANGVTLNMSESNCQFSGNWMWISAGTPYSADLSVQNADVTLSVGGVGSVSGSPSYSGVYSTLWVGYSGDGDWPECSGTIDSMRVEPLP